jgi:hypothetical protein
MVSETPLAESLLCPKLSHFLTQLQQNLLHLISLWRTANRQSITEGNGAP